MTGLVPRGAAAVVVGVVVACGLWGMSQGAGLHGPDTGPDTGREPGHRTQAVVVDVVDGDTVRVKTRAGRELPRIRILGIVH
jgi:endonuclease YncB( thermonuclease family)